MSARDTILDAIRTLLPSFAVSDGSVEAKMVDAVGTYADSEAIERQNSINVINDALARQRVTTRDYYRRKAVEFQNGDALTYDPVDYHAYYEVVDTSRRLIKQANIIGTYPYFTLLVNKTNSDGRLQPLISGEIAAFRTYFEAFQPLGLAINIASLAVAQITDPSLRIYIQAGADAGEVAFQINANLLAYESEFRPANAVTLSEIEDVIQRVPQVRAVGWGSPRALETLIDGTTRTTYPSQGVFSLESGAFSFRTDVTPAMLHVLI